MPYIQQKRRMLFDRHVDEIVKNLGAELFEPATSSPPTFYQKTVDEDKAKGDLNYVIYRMVKHYIDKHGLRYHRINDFMAGTLTHVQHELLRRISDPYEDEAIKKNGDIF